MKTDSHPLSVLNYHITGAIARGEQPIVAMPLPVPSCIAERSEEDLARCYLDWMNNYISTDGFADAYGIQKWEAVALITAGRDAHERIVSKL